MKLCADFETTSEYQYMQEGLTKVYLWGCDYLYEDKYEWGISIESFMEYLISLNDDIVCYFHNLSFDGEFLIYSFMENGYTPVYGVDELNDDEFTHITSDNGTIYKIEIKLYGHKIEFRCSYRLIPVSIKDLGKLVGVEKLDETYDYNCIRHYNSKEEVDKDTLKYLYNDVNIMKQAIVKAIEQDLTKLTIASSAYSSWKSEMFNFEKYLCQEPKNEEANQTIDASYRGGITMCNPRIAGKMQYNLCSYDVNSLYPSTMLKYDMPCGEPKKVDDFGTSKYNYLVKIYVHYAKIKKGYHPFIPCKMSRLGSYDYDDEFDNIVLCLWYDEFTLFRLYYDVDYTLQDIWRFRKYKDVFSKYFDKWKHIKETTKNPVEKKIAKLMMNSLYGKFGTNDDKFSKEIQSFSNEIISYVNVPNETKYYYRAIASYITSQARCTLIRAIEQNADRFLYCDTDSIYLKGTEIPDLPIHDTKLGFWGFEGNYPQALFIKAKCYIKTLPDGKLETRVAGLPKKAQALINYDNFHEGLTLKNVKLQHKRVKGGVVLHATDFTIKV